MEHPVPWKHGKKRARSVSHISPRLRQNEAISEARSSLEQISGIQAPARVRPWKITWSWLKALSPGWEQLWKQGPANWINKLRKNGRGDTPAESTTPFRLSQTRNYVWRRLPAHLSILLLLAFLMLTGGFRGVLAQSVQANQGGMSLTWQRVRPAGESETVMSAYASIPAMPVTVKTADRPTAPEPLSEEEEPASYFLRSDVITYTVEEGDTLISIAGQFDLSVETLYWFNELKSADILAIGQKIKVPPTDGLLHTIDEGDTLDSIAEDYGVRKGNMIAYGLNNLREPYDLVEDEVIFVPGAAKPIPRPAATSSYRPASVRLVAPPYAALPGGERFSWPASGRITDRFGWTGTRWHTGLDIAAPWGTPIYSAAAGTVTFAGWKSGYGYTVWISHGEGWDTRYGHMAQQPEVYAGQWVERGQLIGFIGCTGWCTGPHVHFEVRYNGTPVDPLSYLQ